MNKKIFFLILLLSNMFFNNYAFGIVIPPPIIHSTRSCNCDLTEVIYEKKGEEVVKKECLKKEYLFLNKGEEYCVIKDVMSEREYFIGKIFVYLIVLSPILFLFLLKYYIDYIY